MYINESNCVYIELKYLCVYLKVSKFGDFSRG